MQREMKASTNTPGDHFVGMRGEGADCLVRLAGNLSWDGHAAAVGICFVGSKGIAATAGIAGIRSVA